MVGMLSKDVWGASTVGPRDPENGLEDVTMKQWDYWDGKILKGPDGRYHMFASRWEQARESRLRKRVMAAPKLINLLSKYRPVAIFLGLILLGLEPALAGSEFVHPGGLHTAADLDRMRSMVAAGEHPWIDGWNVLIRDWKAQSDYKALPNPHMGSRQRAQNDANAAYLNALRWQISGDKANADCAARILDAWAAR